MMRTLSVALFLAAGAQALHAEALQDSLARMFRYDTPPFELQSARIATRDDIEVFDVTYASPKGGRVTAYLVAPAKPKKKSPALVFGHWGPGDRTEFLPDAELFARVGVISLLIDYPWVRPAPHRRDQAPGIAGPEVDRDLFVQAVVDLRRGIDLLIARGDVDPARIAYVGHSYGAQWGAILAAVDDRVGAAILMGGVGSTTDMISENPDPAFVGLRAGAEPGQLERYVVLHRPLDGIRWVPYAAPTPLLFQFARFERFDTEAAMTRYFDAASKPKAVRWYDTGHDLNDVQALIDRSDFLEKNTGTPSIRPLLEHAVHRVE